MGGRMHVILNGEPLEVVDCFKPGILTYRRYTQREFKLKFSALLKPNDGKYTEKSKN